LKTIDIWGFIMSYNVFLDRLYELYEYDNLNENQSLFVRKIKHLIIHFLFENPTESIVTSRLDELVKELNDLNDIISDFSKSNKKYNNNLFLLSKKDIQEIGGSSNRKTRKTRKP
jgi:hypothetical protein